VFVFVHSDKLRKLKGMLCVSCVFVCLCVFVFVHSDKLRKLKGMLSKQLTDLQDKLALLQVCCSTVVN
jgi:hypothetical protein